MLSEKTKSLVRHILTALGLVLSLTGLVALTDAIEFISINLDDIWAALNLLVGVILSVWGFFKDKGERFESRAAK